MIRNRGARLWPLAQSLFPHHLLRKCFGGKPARRSAAPRRLALEPCEQRNLLAVVGAAPEEPLAAEVSGQKFTDATGDGFSPDDMPLGGVTIDLFRDGGDGQFNRVEGGVDDDTLVDTDMTDPGTGAYGFAGLADGLYFIQEQVPAGYLQTAPTSPAYYTFEVIDGTVYAGTNLVVDDFGAPSPPQTYFITLFDADPTLLKAADPAILTGERDLLVDVVGVPNVVSAGGQVGASGGLTQYDFASAVPGTRATLQYDGIDADDPGTPALVRNTSNASVDLTDGGVNTGFRLDFPMIQVGAGMTDLQVDVELFGPGGTSATFSGTVPESNLPRSLFIPFTAFTTFGGFSFADANILEFTFNNSGVADTDFTLDNIVLTNRRETGFDFANFAVLPGIDVEKGTNNQHADAPTGPLVGAGCPVHWLYTVNNTGNVPLADVTVVDDAGTPGVPGDDFAPDFVSGDANGNGLLDLDETWVYVASGIAEAGQYENIVTAEGRPTDLEGEPLDDFDPVTDTDPSHYFGVLGGIHIEKATNGQDADSPTGPILEAGETVTWTYAVTNTGNTPLANVTVTDDAGTAGEPGDDFAPAFVSGDTNGNSLLDLGETWLYEAAGIVAAGQYENIAVAVGQPANLDGVPVVCVCEASDTDPSHYFGVAAAIDVEKSTNGDDADSPTGPHLTVGDPIQWTYVVTNPGNVPLANVTVVDDAGTPGIPGDDFSPNFVSGDTNGNNLLDPGEAWVYAFHNMAEEGQYENIITAAGTPVDEQGQPLPDIGPVEAEDPSHYLAVMPLSSLSGFVYIDVNDNGHFDPTESPLPNTTVLLTGTTDLGDPVSESTTTDADGFYIFTDLRPGTYRIEEVQPAAYIDGKDTIGTPGGDDSVNDVFSSIELPPGFDGTQNNFGELGLNGDLVSKRSLLFPFGYWVEPYDGSSQTQTAPTGSVPIYTGGDVAAWQPEAETSGVAETFVLMGTSGDDLLEVVPNPGAAWTVKLNGRTIDVDPVVRMVQFDGLGGNDRAVLAGTDAADTLSAGPEGVLLGGENYAIVLSQVEAVTVDGRGGDDVAELLDTAGNDQFTQWPGGALLVGSGYEFRVEGFAETVGRATAGGVDVAKFYDSPGNDTFVAGQGAAELVGPGFHSRAEGFDGAHAYATAGGIDTAKLYDSAGNDIFAAGPIEGALFGEGFYNRAKFFEGVHAYATAGGIDTAKLYDSAGDDRFVADPNQGALFGDGFYNRAKFFEGVHAYATAGGHDTATLHDSAGNDRLIAEGVQAALFGDGFFNRTKFFEQVEIAPGRGDDTSEVDAVDFVMFLADDWR